MRSISLAICALACALSSCVVHTGGGSVGTLAGDPLDADLFLTWVTRDTHTGLDISCHSAGADTVRVTARNAQTGVVVTDLFDCEKTSGKTYSLTAGDYDVSVDLVYCDGDPSCRAPQVLSSAPRVGPIGVWYAGTLDLGDFVFMVD